MPAPAMSSRHLYTGHRRGHIQAAPRLRAHRGEPLSQDHPQIPVSMPSLFRFDASAVVHTCSSSHRTPAPLTARRQPQRSPPRLLTDAACGGLESPPARRPRRTYLHHWHSTDRADDLLHHHHHFPSGHTWVPETGSQIVGWSSRAWPPPPVTQTSRTCSPKATTWSSSTTTAEFPAPTRQDQARSHRRHHRRLHPLAPDAPQRGRQRHRRPPPTTAPENGCRHGSGQSKSPPAAEEATEEPSWLTPTDTTTPRSGPKRTRNGSDSATRSARRRAGWIPTGRPLRRASEQ